jgi:hypothetical protein
MDGTADVLRAITSTEPLANIRRVREKEIEKDRLSSSKKPESDPR